MIDAEIPIGLLNQAKVKFVLIKPVEPVHQAVFKHTVAVGGGRRTRSRTWR